MNIIGRQNKVAELELCVRCLRLVHTGPCVNRKNNEACDRCLPDRKFHNSRLCPNAGTQANEAMKASRQSNKRKLKQTGRNGSAKRQKLSNNRHGSQKSQATINKVSEWSQLSNAMASIPNQPRLGKSEKTVLLATMNILIHELKTNIITNCRSIADMGATLNCIASKFISEHNLPTIKCQKRILGVSGPEFIKRKLIVEIKPWFESEFSL